MGISLNICMLSREKKCIYIIFTIWLNSMLILDNILYHLHLIFDSLIKKKWKATRRGIFFLLSTQWFFRCSLALLDLICILFIENSKQKRSFFSVDKVSLLSKVIDKKIYENKELGELHKTFNYNTYNNFLLVIGRRSNK